MNVLKYSLFILADLKLNLINLIFIFCTFTEGHDDDAKCDVISGCG